MEKGLHTRSSRHTARSRHKLQLSEKKIVSHNRPHDHPYTCSDSGYMQLYIQLYTYEGKYFSVCVVVNHVGYVHNLGCNRFALRVLHHDEYGFVRF